MTGLVVRKRISLDFLGDEYKDSYLVFKSMPVREYDQVEKDSSKIKQEDYLKFIIDQLGARFTEGKIKQGSDLVDVTSENLNDLPGEVFLEAWERVTGKIDPKD